MEINPLQELTENAWEEFRARYHANVASLMSGGDGSTAFPGDGILQVRSASHRVATFLLSVTDSLNGSGELPDASLLLSSAVSEGLSLEDFTCMVLSLMFLMDGIYLIHTGKSDTVAQMLDNFLATKVQPTTAVSTPLKMHGPPATTQFQEPEDVSTAGVVIKKDLRKSAPLDKKKRSRKTKTATRGSRKRKSTPKKRRKSKRK